MALALVHADNGSAKENVMLLRRRIEGSRSWLRDKRWSDLFDAERIEPRAEGRVLLVKLPGGLNALRWIFWVSPRHPLLLHE